MLCGVTPEQRLLLSPVFHPSELHVKEPRLERVWRFSPYRLEESRNPYANRFFVTNNAFRLSIQIICPL